MSLIEIGVAFCAVVLPLGFALHGFFVRGPGGFASPACEIDHRASCIAVIFSTACLGWFAVGLTPDIPMFVAIGAGILSASGWWCAHMLAVVLASMVLSV